MIQENSYAQIKEYYKNNPAKFAEDFLGVKLQLWQKIWLKLMNKNARSSSKTGINFMMFLESLKQKAKTEEERLYYEALQKEWSKFCVSSTLGYWEKL